MITKSKVNPLRHNITCTNEYAYCLCVQLQAHTPSLSEKLRGISLIRGIRGNYECPLPYTDTNGVCAEDTDLCLAHGVVHATVSATDNRFRPI